MDRRVSTESDVGYLGVTTIRKMASLLIPEVISQRPPMPEVRTCKKPQKLIEYLKLEGIYKDHLILAEIPKTKPSD